MKERNNENGGERNKLTKGKQPKVEPVPVCGVMAEPL